jgi:hypothetical protein
MPRWSVLSELPPFTTSGVYVLYREGRVVYVGQSGNIRERLQAHARRFVFDRVKCRRLRTRRSCQRVERQLLRRLRPVENRSFPGAR